MAPLRTISPLSNMIFAIINADLGPELVIEELLPALLPVLPRVGNRGSIRLTNTRRRAGFT